MKSGLGTENEFGIQGDYGIWLGGSPNEAKFKVRNTGILTARDVDLTGKITAINGKIGGFTFQDFEKFLKKEKFKYTYKEIQQFIFKQIKEKKLIQHFWSNNQTNRLQQESDGEKAILYLDESIWFVYNNKLSK